MSTKDTIAANAAMFSHARHHLEDEGYVEIHVPRVVRASGACENVNTLFEVSNEKNFAWFGSQSYLAQTGQLYLEALVPTVGKVYCAGPSFRAENAVDNRHLTEFQMIEIELPSNFDGLLREIEGVVSAIARGMVSDHAAGKLTLSEESNERLRDCPQVFPKVTYDEAIDILKESGERIEWGDDISSTREKMLLEHFGEKPLFITRYPDPHWDHGKEIEVEKFFNMLPDPDYKGRVLSADLILPYGGEAVGSAARVHRADVMVSRLKRSRMFKRLLALGGSLDDFRWYTDILEKQGSIPHAGCGFGMARIAQWILGTTDIREAVVFPSNRASLI